MNNEGKREREDGASGVARVKERMGKITDIVVKQEQTI